MAAVAEGNEADAEYWGVAACQTVTAKLRTARTGTHHTPIAAPHGRSLDGNQMWQTDRQLVEAVVVGDARTYILHALAQF